MKKSLDTHLCQGLPVAPLDKILATQAELIEKSAELSRFHCGRLQPACFAGDPAVCRVCSPVASFRITPPPWRWWSVPTWAWRPSGQLRHLSQLSFSIEGRLPERRDNEPRWRMASCFSGCCMMWVNRSPDVHYGQRRVNHMEPVFGVTFADWAHRHEIDRYFIRWRDKRHKKT